MIVAPLVALALKRTLLRGETPAFVMEMPLYKVPSLRTVVRRMVDSGWAFVCRAGTLILASMVLVWALLYFPRVEPDGRLYDEHYAQLQKELEEMTRTPATKPTRSSRSQRRSENEANALQGEWQRQSVLGRMGQAIEPAVRPLGWDWRIGMAALASFPAREVVVGTLGIDLQRGQGGSATRCSDAEDVGDTTWPAPCKQATWDGTDRKVYTVPVALSLMVFFALCCQCASTLAVIRRETRSWRWPAFTFAYMTVLAYVGALAVYQIGSLFL